MKLPIALTLVLACGLARADDAASVDHYLSVTGDIAIDTQGAVTSIEVEESNLAPAVVQLVERKVASWRFEPVVENGNAVAAKSQVRLELLARPVDNGDIVLSVNQVAFGTSKPRGEKAPPTYPRNALQEGMEARVIVLARLDAAGDVTDAHAYQVNLSKKGSSERWRKAFGEAAVRSVEQWRFEPATGVAEAASRVIATPLEFSIGSGRSKKDAIRNTTRWRSYLEGPVSLPAWATAEQVAALNVDGLPTDGDAAVHDARFRLASNVIGVPL